MHDDKFPPVLTLNNPNTGVYKCGSALCMHYIAVAHIQINGVETALYASVPWMKIKKWGKQGDKKRERCLWVSFLSPFEWRQSVTGWMITVGHHTTGLIYKLSISRHYISATGWVTSSLQRNCLVLLKICSSQAVVVWEGELKEKKLRWMNGWTHQWVMCYTTCRTSSWTGRKTRQRDGWATSAPNTHPHQ